MACIECNKSINDQINYVDENRINFTSGTELIRIQGVAGGNPFFIPNDNNLRYTSDENFEGFGLPPICNTTYSSNTNNMNQYYSEANGLFRFNFPYFLSAPVFSRQTGMLRNANRPEANSYFYARNPTIKVNHIGLNGGEYSHGYPNCFNNPNAYIARFPNIVYTDNDFKLRTDVQNDTMFPTLYLPFLDGGILIGFINSSLTKSWWLYLEHGHRRCSFINCSPAFSGTVITANNYNQESANCGFYGYLFELSREEMDQYFDAFVTFNTNVGTMVYTGFKLLLSALPESRFTKFRAWYRIRKRTTCHPDNSFSSFHTVNPSNINLYCGLIISELSDSIEFSFKESTNQVEFKYGNRFTHIFSNTHDNQYITPFFTSARNDREPSVFCANQLPEGTRPLSLSNQYPNSAGQFDMISNYPYIYGENPFLNFPRLNRV